MANTRRPSRGAPAPPPPTKSTAPIQNELRAEDRNRINTNTPPDRKRGSRGASRKPAPPQPVYPPAEALLAHRADIRATVVACRVPRDEVDEVAATCLVAAWAAIQQGEFRVHPWVDPAEALRRWLYGITWRLSGHERDRAWHRHEILVDDPWALAAELRGEPAYDPEGQLQARAGLRALSQLPVADRKLLLAVARGATTAELAGPLGVFPRAVLLRIEKARQALRALIEGTG